MPKSHRYRTVCRGRKKMAYFPMFIELKDKCCLVVGGGRVALRKVEVLRDFGARITVAAPSILPEIQAMEGIVCQKKYFEKSDLEGQELVVAATDDPEQNHRISQICREEKIPVNAVDQKEDCSFIFPAYQKEGNVVAAFSSGGKSPAISQYLKSQIRPAMPALLGELAEMLGDLRAELCDTGSESVRKSIYREILECFLEKGTVPSKEETDEIIVKYKTKGQGII